ncbi:MAG: hypothetical protein IKP58_16665 [Victivallales bacterium]|nr:hypothetical protein [Victivallales bacterium]
MVYIWMFFCLSVCGIMELMLGISGIHAPLLLLGMFYFGAFKQWRFALFAGMFIGCIVELSYGRFIPMCLLTMPLLTLFSKFWRWIGGTMGMLRQSIPGLLTGALDGFSCVLLKMQVMGTTEGCWRMVWVSAAIGFVFLPLMCGIFDMVAGWLALGRFTRLSSGHHDGNFWEEEVDYDEEFID